jgi:hypothetical protein
MSNLNKNLLDKVTRPGPRLPGIEDWLLNDHDICRQGKKSSMKGKTS